MKISCIIPAWNEEKRIALVINKVRPFVDEIIVVDDGCLDRSSEEAEKAGAIVLRHLINLGQGAALRTGTEYALNHGADIIVHFDADDQFAAAEIPEVIAPLLSGEAQVVFGSRFLGKKSNLPAIKKQVIIPLARLVNHFLGINLSDPQSGFRALDRKAAQTIKTENNRMAHCSEYIAQAFKYRLKIQEVPITVSYHEFGQNMNGGFRIIKDLIIQKIIK